jgi:folate-binding protein YgfZ
MLAPGRSVLTVLTSPTGRILDVLHLVREEGQAGPSLLALTLPDQAGKTAAFLKNRIFFMDQVAVTDTGAEFIQVDLEGVEASALLGRLGLDPPGLDEVTSGEIHNLPIRVIGKRGLAGLGYRLLAPSPADAVLEDTLALAGATRLEVPEYEILRVEAGLPAAGAELIETYTPLEAGLDRAISSTKGCYTGQEVIARQVTYDKVTQHLTGLKLDLPVKAGDEIWAEGRQVGKITSAVASPRLGPIALGIIKRPYHTPGQTVAVGKAGLDRLATVVTLPFTTQ